MKVINKQKTIIKEEFSVYSSFEVVFENNTYVRIDGYNSDSQRNAITPIKFLKKSHKALGDIIENLEAGTIDKKNKHHKIIEKPKKKWYEFWK